MGASPARSPSSPGAARPPSPASKARRDFARQTINKLPTRATKRRKVPITTARDAGNIASLPSLRCAEPRAALTLRRGRRMTRKALARPLAAFTVVAAAAAVVAGCGSSSATTPAGTTTATTATGETLFLKSAAGAKVTVRSSRYGKVLFDGRGYALYLFTADRTTRSTCYGGCAKAWPPFLTITQGEPVAGPGVHAGLFGTTRRRDGSGSACFPCGPAPSLSGGISSSCSPARRRDSSSAPSPAGDSSRTSRRRRAATGG